MKTSARLFLSLTLILFSFYSYSQEYALIDSLKRNYEASTTAAEKVKWLGQLSSFYMNIDKALSEKYVKELFEIAELSRDRKVMLDALLTQANANFNSGGVQERLDKGKKYSQQALQLAKSSQMTDYEAWAYLYLARGARNEGENDKALNYNNLALSIANSLEDDSLKISALNSLGSTYAVRKDKLLAFRSFLQALNLAEDVGKYDQLAATYYLLSGFYSDLEEYEKAKDYLFKAFDLTLKHDKPYDRLDAYHAIGDIYVRTKNYDLAKSFYEKTMGLADTLKLSIYKLNSYGKIVDMYFISDQAEKALAYFKEKNELREFMINAGVEFYIHHAYGIAYSGIKKYDSAEYYFRLAEKAFETKVNKYNRYYFYSHYAKHLKRVNNYNKALEYTLKARKIGEERADIAMLKNTAESLDSIYQNLGDFKNAYFYNRQYHRFKDSLQSMEAEKELLALEVDNENKKKEKEAQLEEAQKRERHNIQYMGITVGIAAVFMVLVMLGIFSVSKTTIRILGFFAFIFLFEFIILLADNQIHHWTHGEPWKILAIKIGLISVLLPLHHFLEERVIHYLTSRKLLEVNPKDLLNKIRKTEADVA